MELRILDTSKWQHSKVDYAAAKRAGYAGVILRIGCGGTKDSCFEKDFASATAAGMLVGVYHYTYSTNETQAAYDAVRVLNWLNGRKLSLPIAYDIEDAKQKGASRKIANSNMYNQFSAQIKAKGYDCMLYTGEHFFNNYFDKDMIKDKLWIAKYSTKAPSVGRDVYMWQYTSAAFATDFYTAKLDRSILYVQDNIAAPAPNVSNITPTIISGVNHIQHWLNAWFDAGLEVDGKYGKLTKAALIRALQTVLGVPVTGVWDEATANAVGVISLKDKDTRSLKVTLWQAVLVCNKFNPNGIDGFYGEDSAAATALAQHHKGLRADKKVGKLTWGAYLG